MGKERLSLKPEEKNEITILRFDGDLDMNTLPIAKETMNEFLDNGKKFFIFELSRLQMIDSAGIGFFNGMIKKLQRNYNGNLKLLNLSAYIEKIFNLLKLDYFIEIFDDEREAIRSFGADFEGSSIVSKWQKIISLQPDYADAHYQLSTVLYQLGDYSDAKKEVQIAIELNPRYLDAMLLSSQICIKLGEMDNAKEFFNGILEIDPVNPSALLGLGEINGEEELVQEAIHQLEKHTSERNNHADFHKLLGEAYFFKKDFDRSLYEFNFAKKINPSYGEIYYWIGKIIYLKGDYTRANETFRKALDLLPDSWKLKVDIENQISEIEKLINKENK
ncbi:tetratricopeptide repeat protein [bacterium]|nr:tetratricopeptide repeat protein [bacterium]